jgi:hypothetical protein
MNQEDYDTRKEYEEDYKEKVRLLALCYHNMSIEEEYFKNYAESRECAKKAYELMKSKFGENYHFTKKFRANYYSKINKEPADQKSTFTIRPLSHQAKRRESVTSKAEDRGLPQWKIKENPYSQKTPSKFHIKCVVNPHYSQNSPMIGRPQSSKGSVIRPITKVNNFVGKNESQSQKVLKRPDIKIKVRTGVKAEELKKESEYEKTMKELKDLGVTSSEESSDASEKEDEKKEMLENRKRFLREIEKLEVYLIEPRTRTMLNE